MKTVNCVPRVGRERGAGGAGRTAGHRVLLSGEGKVVDLAAWKAENLMETDEPEEERANTLGQYAGRELNHRRQRRLTAAQDRAELAATLAVAAAFAALVLRVLLF